MNFIDALLSIELVLESGAVPLLIGESGIGKTALIKKLCKKNNYYSIVIDGNMLKEGEIGGLPTIEDYFTIVDGVEVTKKRTIYAVHTKLQEIDGILFKEPGKTVLLFIDEINRCEHTVQQELMNIILNREINGYRLSDAVRVVAAMNPSSKYAQYSMSDYQVVDLDPAQEDRFVWIDMEADVKSWIAWGMEEGQIHEDILAFISSYPEYLHTPNSTEMVKATPRSWERVSSAYKAYLTKKGQLPDRIFLNVVKGNVGGSIAQEFYGFLENNKNPLIKAEDVFLKDTIDDGLIARIKKESHSRLYMTARKLLRYIVNSEAMEKDIKLFSSFLQYYPKDLRLAIMREIRESYYEELYEKFLNQASFIEGFFEVYV